MTFHETTDSNPAQRQNIKAFNEKFQQRENAFKTMKKALNEKGDETNKDFDKAMYKAELIVDLAANIIDRHNELFTIVEKIEETEKTIEKLNEAA
tara:strand:- start:207 stop:491 length:285 start_codon:yes stop_codon:yes gene_type:complete